MAAFLALEMAEIREILTLNSNLFFRDLKIKSRNGGECGEWMWSMIWPSFWDLLSEFAKIALASFCTHWYSNCTNNCKRFHSFYTAIRLSNMLNAISIVRKKQLTAYAMYISFSFLDFLTLFSRWNDPILHSIMIINLSALLQYSVFEKV